MPKYFDESSWHWPILVTNEDRLKQRQQIDRNIWSVCFRSDVYHFQEFYIAKPCYRFILAFHVWSTSMSRRLLCCLRRLPSRFYCTWTTMKLGWRRKGWKNTMARQPVLLIISVISKFMFTAAFLHSFASVKHFNAVVYIVYPQPSGLHFKPPCSQSIADNQLTHLFHLLH